MIFSDYIDSITGETTIPSDWVKIEEWLVDGAYDICDKLKVINPNELTQFSTDFDKVVIADTYPGVSMNQIVHLTSVSRGWKDTQVYLPDGSANPNYNKWYFYSAEFVDGPERVRATRSGSMFEATNKHPVYYLANDKAYIYPEPIEDDDTKYAQIITGVGNFAFTGSTNDNTGAISNFPKRYYNLLGIYAGIFLLGYKMGQYSLEPSPNITMGMASLPTEPEAPDTDWDSLTQTLTEMLIPSGVIIETIDWTDAPVLDWTFPSEPVQPSIDWTGVTQSISEIELPPDVVPPSLNIDEPDVVTWTFPDQPVLLAPDWADTEKWITSEEDAEMLNARIQDINAKLKEYQTKVQAFTSVINGVVAQNQGKIQTWGDEWKTRVQRYSAELNALIEKYKGESQGKQSIVQAQVAAHNAQVQFVVNRANAEVSMYTAQIQAYSSNIQSIITKNNGILTAWSNEMQSKVQKFSASVQASIQKYQADIQAQTSFSQSQINIRSSQLSEDTARNNDKVQKYQLEVEKYKQGVAYALQDFSNKIQDNMSKIQKYQSDLTSNKMEYDWKVQRLIQLKQQYGEHLGMLGKTNEQNRPQMETAN